ncbi:MAG: DUF2314 domain-containing protein [Planctomycetota bacterium]|nr:DUF2314 domain-containing protein [Planctomycetota bacterium]
MNEPSESKSPIFYFDHSDPDTITAAQNAQETFRFLWRELSWEQRRIIPALDMAAIKVAFCDDPNDAKSPVEHMWMNEIDFDGHSVSGVLINSPRQLESVSLGDFARVPLDRLGDWIYAIDGIAYGAYSVQLMRSKMSEDQRVEHDEAWGLDFGDPTHVRVVPPEYDLEGEHPMSKNMGDSFKTFLEDDPELVSRVDERGWTLLHHQSLAGNKTIVDILLKSGADPRLKGTDGRSPIDLASAWPFIESTLRES